MKYEYQVICRFFKQYFVKKEFDKTTGSMSVKGFSCVKRVSNTKNNTGISLTGILNITTDSQ